MTLRKAIPIDYFEIILEFSDGRFRKFTPSHSGPTKQFTFLMFPHKLKAFRLVPQGLEWYNGVQLNFDFLMKHSTPILPADLIHKSLQLGYRNNAPTLEDSRHHEYYCHVNPFDEQNPITIGESIGGGHAERGGQRALGLAELFNLDWEDHFRKAGCEWAIEIIEKHNDQSDVLIDQLVASVRERFYSTVND
jgi:hypothetical protein